MAVRIKGSVPQGNVGRSSNRPAVKKKEGESRSESASAKVDISAKDTAVSAVMDASRGVSEVDEAKVAELREKLSRGEYQADLKVVAERIISEAVAFGK
ncbi:MAG: flagellar biosynthesis anti-sigma factor FlgM [Bradymonadia bacterium]